MRILRHPQALLVVLLLPLLVAGVGMWALKDRVDRLDHVPAAVVNLDEGVQMEVDGKTQTVPFGRSLAGSLTQPGTAKTGADAPTTGFDWTLTDEADARSGLRDGTYAAVIVIPKDFSRKLGTIGKPEAVPATIQVTTNDASGALDSALGTAISQAAAAATGTEMTRQYLSQLYVGFNTLHDSFGQAADGASQLNDGVNGLHDGLGQTSEGATQLADGVDGLAGGAHDLANGSGQLADGVQQTSDGATQLADGADGLATGASQLASGVSGVADGTDQLAAGINGTPQQPGLRQGIDQLNAGVQGDGTPANPGLVAGANQLADGAETFAGGVATAFRGDGTASNPGLVAGAQQAADGTSTYVDGVSQYVDGVDAAFGGVSPYVDGVEQYTQGVDKIAHGTGGTKDSGMDGLATTMATVCGQFTDAERADPRIAGLCGAPGGDPQQSVLGGVQGYAMGLDTLSNGSADLVAGGRALSTGMDTSGARGQLGQAGQQLVLGGRSGDPTHPGLAEGAQQFASGVKLAADGDGTSANPGLVAGAQQLAAGTRTSAQQAPQLANGIQQLATGVHDLGDGATQLSSGTRQLATGATQLSDGTTQLADGTRVLADGTVQLADGARKLSDGTIQLADGTTQLADGSRQLADGTVQLADGSGQLADGSKDLANGLRQGADGVPTYTDAQRKAMSDAAAQPVSSVAKRQNEADGSSTAVFPFVTALALWLGAFGAFLLLPALSRRFLDAAMPMWQVVLRSLLPAVVLGLIQTVVVLGVITAMGISPVSPVSVGVVSLLGAIVFAAFHQALMAVFGNRVGRIASVVMMVLQVVVLAGILPLQTAPPVLQTLSGLMPITIVSQGLVHASLGGAVVSTASTCLGLLAGTAVAVVITMIASRNARSLENAPLVTENDALPA